MKKIASYILILVVLIGFFSPAILAHAQPAPTAATTTTPSFTNTNNYIGGAAASTAAAQGLQQAAAVGASPTPPNPPAAEASTPFELAVNEQSCGSITGGISIGGCMVQLFYFIFYTIPAFLLGVAGKIFDVVFTFALNRNTYNTDFVNQAWIVVRDFSNIFFILILLYTAIQMILRLGHDAKKVIVHVIIMALLINFSLFFTRVVIDSSNILALIFYNQINAPAGDTPADVVTLADRSIPEKGLSARLVQGFDLTRVINQDFLDQAKNRSGFSVVSVSSAAYAAGGAYLGSLIVPGIGTAVGALAGVVLQWLQSARVPPSLLISIILVGGLIMYYAAYTFFVVTITFLSRIIELWLCMIFAPFAFMSFSLPALSKVSSIGWEGWVRKLFQMAFFGPIFLFFLFLIFKIIDANITQNLLKPTRTPDQQWLIETIVLISIAAFLILGLLRKATDFAKKSAGEFGNVAIGVGKSVAGLAIGGVVGGGFGLAAKGLQGTVGHVGKMASESEGAARWATNEEKGWRGGLKRFAGSTVISRGNAAAKESFDFRTGVIGGALGAVGKVTGLKLNSGIVSVEAGGYEADLKRRDAKRKQRADELKKAASSGEEEKLRETEAAHQTLLLKEDSHGHTNESRIEQLDKDLVSARQNENDLRNKAGNIDVRDAAKVAARDALVAAIRALPDTDPLKATKLASALAQDITNPLKVEARDAAVNAYQAAADKLSDLKGERSAIKNAEKFTKSTGEEVDETTNTHNGLTKAAGGKSINIYENKEIVDAKHRVHDTEQKAARAYANQVENQGIRYWNEGEYKKSAHDIRMGVKAESHGDNGGKKGGMNFFGTTMADVVAHEITKEPSPAAESGGHEAHGHA